MWTIGLDYHVRTSTMHILDAQGNTVKSQTIRGTWEALVAELRTIVEPFRIVYEASCGYGHLYEQLSQVARDVKVAHPGQLRLIFRSKRKNDRVDARKLAMLGHLDQVPQVHVPGQDVRSWRELIEFRRRMVDNRTSVKNRIRTLMRTYGVSQPSGMGSLWTRKGLAWLRERQWPHATAALRCEMLLDDLEHAEKRVRKVTAELDRIAKRDSGVALLRTIPGVGPRTAEAIVAYIDDPRRFSRSKCIGAYFGLVPSQDSSAKVNRLGHITKQGPATARKLLIEAVWQAIRRDAHIRGYFDRIVAGKPDRRKIALVATAHHLLRCMLEMLKAGEVWNPRDGRPGGRASGRPQAA
jgi:transposase